MATARRTAAPARRGAPAAPARSSGYRGAEALRRMEEEEAKAEARKEARSQMSHMPFRFYVPSGESREIVIVDEAPDWFRYEHNLYNQQSKRWDIYTACINEHTNCPVCEAVSDRQPYFGMFLTIIDLEPYTRQSDGEEIPWSKKLLVVKAAQQKKIMRLFERHGNLRGMVLQMTRDGDKDAQIGNDIEFIEFLEEEQLLEYVTDYTDKEGKVHEIDGSVPFDYDELFPQPTEEQLIALVGGQPAPGSRAGNSRALGGRDAGGSGRPAVRRRPPEDDGRDPPPRRSAVGRRAEPEQEPEDPPARRSAVGRAAPPARNAAPARRMVTGRRSEPEEVQDEGGDDAPQEDAPRGRTVAATRRPVPTRRAAPEPEQEAEAEDPPQRGASLADRRRALRRG